MTSHEPDAVILLGHGSRVPGASEAMQQVAKTLRDDAAGWMVEVCFMSRLGPHFDEVFDRCVDQGARSVMLIPYFLHEGLHMKLDVPEMMQACARRHPDVRLVLGKSLGYDPSLADLVRRRIDESLACPDVRELELPPREQFPVPPGQHEFVAMPPQEAARYHATRYDHDHRCH